jgi:hypothetical protein
MEEYITSRGVKVGFLGIATLISSLQSSLETTKPKPPSYEVVTLGGAKEFHVHDSSTLETDADKAAFESYEKLLAEWDSKSQRDLMRLIFLRGISVEMPNDSLWEKMQTAVGIIVPQEDIAKRIHYIETEVLGGVVDYEALVVGVMRMSGVPEEVLSQVEDTFRGSLGRNKVVGATDQSGEVANVSAVRAGSDRVRDGAGAKSVR